MIAHAMIHAIVRPRTVVWFMTAADGAALGHGEVSGLAELRGVQVRAGIVEVVIADLGSPVTFSDWRTATKAERAAIEALGERAGYRFSL